MKTKTARPILSLALLVVLTMSSVTAVTAANAPGGESPDAVFERLRDAVINEDHCEVASCLAPQGRAQMNTMMIAVAGMVVAFSQMGSEMAAGMGEADQAQEAASATNDLQAQLEELLARNGIDDSFLEKPPGAAEGDLPEELESVDLYADIMTFMEELPNDDDSGPDKGISAPEGDLANLEIDGDEATATIGDEPGKFVRIDGRWYVDPDLDMRPGGGPGD